MNRLPIRVLRAGCIGLLAAIACATAGCAETPSAAGGPVAVPGVPLIGLAKPGSATRATLLGPVRVASEQSPYLFVVRLRIRAGGLTVLVRDASSAIIGERAAARIGPSLLLVPVSSAGELNVEIAQTANTGALDADVESLDFLPVSSANARETAARLAREFEQETGLLADPARENLIDNADFAEDDEVRGTPINWFAYVETTSDPIAHVLHVDGIPSTFRPAAASGPVAVTPGKSYRLFCRFASLDTSVTINIVDYDELNTLAESIQPTAATAEVVLRVTPPPGCHGVRVQFAPQAPGERVSFDLSTIQLEELP